MLPWHQYLFGAIFILAGANHFRKPNMYLKVMPPYIPAHSSMVLLSGIAEMILGFMLLNPETETIAAWGIIAMLIVFIPVHIFMLQKSEAFLKFPKWALILRLILQFALLYWAFQYT